MEWIVYFVLNIIVFIILVDWKDLKRNMWGGILAIVLACTVDSHKVADNKYQLTNLIIEVHNTSVFFLTGPAFVVGTLLVQYHPTKKFWTIANIFVLTGLFSAMEYSLVSRGVVKYIKWNYFDSIIINFAAIMTISWFSMVVLNKNSTTIYRKQ